MKIVIAFGCILILSGCANNFFSKFAITENAASPIIEQQQKFAKVDLVALLDPRQYGRADSFDGLSRLDEASKKSDGSRFFEKIREGLENDPAAEAGLDRLENAFRGFYDPGYQVSTQMRRRNSVQARLIGASDQECGYFLDQIRQDQAGFNFALGSLTSLLGGVGAIVTGADLARAFSGAAAITSGIRAEGNDANFRQLTAEVIVRGIESRRSEIQEKINSRRTSTIDSYTVEDAVADAVKYHSVCNLISGLEHASSQVQLSQDPGLMRTLSLLKKAGVEGPISFDPEKLESDDGAKVGSTGLAAIVSDTTAIRSNATAAIRSIEQLLANAETLVAVLKQRLQKEKTELRDGDSSKEKLAKMEEDIESLDKMLNSMEKTYSKASNLNVEILRLTAQEKEPEATKKAVDLVETALAAQNSFDVLSKSVAEFRKQLKTLAKPKKESGGGE